MNEFDKALQESERKFGLLTAIIWGLFFVMMVRGCVYPGIVDSGCSTKCHQSNLKYSAGDYEEDQWWPSKVGCKCGGPLTSDGKERHP